VGITTIPQANPESPKVISQGPSLCIFQKENPQEVIASWLFVKFLTTNVDFQAEKMMVFADRDAIQRVLINLMDNAVKFSYPNTVIDVKMWFDSKKAYFSVGNYGSGIEKKNLPHVFDRFYKTDESRTNKTSGAGLGLSFVKNIMVLHKQSIWVDSTEAKEGSNVKYTKFTFSLEKA